MKMTSTLNNNICNTLLILALFLALPVGCNKQQQFDSDLWKQKGVDWWITDVRENMVADLIGTDTLIGLKWNGVVELLGEPERSDSMQMQYTVREKFERNIDPEYILDLIIEFDDSKKVVNCKLEKK